MLGPVNAGEPPLFVVLNAAPEPIGFRLPDMPEYRRWRRILNTADDDTDAEFSRHAETEAPPRVVLVFEGSA